MYTVSVGDSQRREPVASCETLAQANMRLSEYLQAQHIKPPYMRYMCYSDQEVWVDYGSWSQFMILTCDENETIRIPDLMGGDE